MNIRDLKDEELLNEIKLRFEEKNRSLGETEYLNKQLIELNNKLLEQDNVKSQFLSLIKNEFNNPISSLLNFSGRLVSNPDSEKRASIAQMMHMEVLRLDFQIKNIIAANEIEAGETKNYISKVDIESVIYDVQKTFKYIIEEKSLNIIIENELNGQNTFSDAHKLELIFSNLLSNACEFSFPNKDIIIRIFIENEKLCVSIKDFGEGILVEQKHAVYNRFARFSQGLTRALTGLGLGLAVVKGMIEVLEGEVDYTTEIGKSTTFLVTLPLLQEGEDSSIGANEFFFDDFDDASEL